MLAFVASRRKRTTAGVGLGDGHADVAGTTRARGAASLSSRRDASRPAGVVLDGPTRLHHGPHHGGELGGL